MKKPIVIALCAVATLSSCTIIVDCIEGNGDIKSEERTVSSFTAIANETSFHVVYIKGSETNITVEAESNILPYIETRVNGGALEIRTVSGTRCLRCGTQPVITVTAPLISELVNAGSGDMVAGDLEGENVKLIVSGSGDISAGVIEGDDIEVVISGSGDIITDVVTASTFKATLTGSGGITTSGTVTSGRYVVSGSGSALSGDLVMKTAVMTLSGSGSVYATVEDNLNAVISGSGNIYLHGDPTVSLTRTGSGRVIYL